MTISRNFGPRPIPVPMSEMWHLVWTKYLPDNLFAKAFDQLTNTKLFEHSPYQWHPTLVNSKTSGSIAFRFGVCLRQLAITYGQVIGGVHLHMRLCTPLFNISQTAGQIAFKFCVARDPLDKSCIQVWCGVHLHVRKYTSLFHISQTAGYPTLRL